jgi:hypothetical protein
MNQQLFDKTFKLEYIVDETNRKIVKKTRCDIDTIKAHSFVHDEEQVDDDFAENTQQMTYMTSNDPSLIGTRFFENLLKHESASYYRSPFIKSLVKHLVRANEKEIEWDIRMHLLNMLSLFFYLYVSNLDLYYPDFQEENYQLYIYLVYGSKTLNGILMLRVFLEEMSEYNTDWKLYISS